MKLRLFIGAAALVVSVMALVAVYWTVTSQILSVWDYLGPAALAGAAAHLWVAFGALRPRRRRKPARRRSAVVVTVRPRPAVVTLLVPTYGLNSSHERVVLYK